MFADKDEKGGAWNWLHGAVRPNDATFDLLSCSLFEMGLAMAAAARAE